MQTIESKTTAYIQRQMSILLNLKLQKTICHYLLPYVEGSVDFRGIQWFSSKNKEGSFIAKREVGGGGIKGGDFGKLTSNDKGSSVYCRIPWYNQNSPISPPTIHYLLPCSEMSEDFVGIPWFSGGNSGDHHCRGGVWREGTLENWLQMRGDHQNTAEPCETTKILWPPPLPHPRQ